MPKISIDMPYEKDDAVESAERFTGQAPSKKRKTSSAGGATGELPGGLDIANMVALARTPEGHRILTAILEAASGAQAAPPMPPSAPPMGGLGMGGGMPPGLPPGMGSSMGGGLPPGMDIGGPLG